MLGRAVRAGRAVEVVPVHPRVGFKKAFADGSRAEAVRVPQGRAKFVNRYGALITAIKLAPFDE